MSLERNQKIIAAIRQTLKLYDPDAYQLIKTRESCLVIAPGNIKDKVEKITPPQALQAVPSLKAVASQVFQTLVGSQVKPTEPNNHFIIEGGWFPALLPRIIFQGEVHVFEEPYNDVRDLFETVAAKLNFDPTEFGYRCLNNLVCLERRSLRSSADSQPA